MNIRLICTITSVTISCFSIGSILTTVFVASSPSKLSINMGGLTSIDYDPDSTYAIGNGKVTYSIYPKHTIYTVKWNFSIINIDENVSKIIFNSLSFVNNIERGNIKFTKPDKDEYKIIDDYANDYLNGFYTIYLYTSAGGISSNAVADKSYFLLYV